MGQRVGVRCHASVKEKYGEKIRYCTPLPLNLANKQQAFLLSVLAIALPHRSGLYSTLATLEPPWWWPCQIQF